MDVVIKGPSKTLFYKRVSIPPLGPLHYYWYIGKKNKNVQQKNKSSGQILELITEPSQN